MAKYKTIQEDLDEMFEKHHGDDIIEGCPVEDAENKAWIKRNIRRFYGL